MQTSNFNGKTCFLCIKDRKIRFINITATKLEDFGTFDGDGPGGTSGTAMAIDIPYNNIVTEAGNYTATLILENEVSSFKIVTEVT